MNQHQPIRHHTKHKIIYQFTDKSASTPNFNIALTIHMLILYNEGF